MIFKPDDTILRSKILYSNKARQIELISELLTQQMNHWMMFSLVLIVLGGTSEYIDSGEPDILMWSLCGLLPVLTFLVRAKVKHFIPFLLGNLCILALTLVVPANHFLYRILWVVCGVGYLIQNFTIRLKSDSMYTTPFPPAVGIGLSVFGIFFLKQVSDKHWDSYYTFTLIGCFALYFVIYYMNHYLNFLIVNDSSSGSIPASEMFHSGMGLVLAYTLTGTVLLLLATNVTWLEVILGILKKGLITFLRFLFSLFPDSSEPDKIISLEKPADSNSDELFKQPIGEPALIWQILEFVCMIAFFCLMIYAFIRLILFIVRFLKERFGLSFRQKNWNMAENTSLDIREKCKPEQNVSTRESFTPFSFLNPGERIRRLYKKKLLGASVALVKGDSEKLALYTARESEEKLGAPGMAAIYEKVRYSNSLITSRDVKEMKDACR